ncbi:aminodeoxychorismate synthase component I [Buchananella felis]|uniref:aminodeoxychorismate synthase component I n=1 Tax=Buchananella felis TaxID=3231492 RepID=UPI00352906AE
MNTQAIPTPPAARFDDYRAGRSLLFGAPERVLVAHRSDQVTGVLHAAQQAVENGRWVYGFLAYEAAPGLDHSLSVRQAGAPAAPGGLAAPAAPGAQAPPALPLAWFAVCGAPLIEPLGGVSEPPGGESGAEPTVVAGQGAAPRPYRLTPWELDWDRAQHAAAVERVKAAIARGDTYQVNLTTRARARFAGDAYAYYLDLAERQRGAFCAYLEAGNWALLSASPESFLEWDGGRLRSVPMKGTAPRGGDPASDEKLRQSLAQSGKDTAENVMIVDLIRNDLARVAEVGSVHVPALFSVEAYPTVWQLTSTVAATARQDAGLADLMGAMFPCGSITGAPKKSTMDLIAELESSPRGIYCGAIGFIEPAVGSAGERRAGFTGSSRGAFSVAIRTVALDRSTGRAEYGVGGGVTWQSTPEGEYAELLTKTRVLHGQDDFALIETFALTAAGARHLERHLARLSRSAQALGFGYDAAALTALLESQIAAALAALPVPGEAAAPGKAAASPNAQAAVWTPEDPWQAPLLLGRLELRRDGTAAFSTRAPARTPLPLRLGLDRPDAREPGFVAAWRRHKTTNRADFEAARARHPGRDDVVLVNRDGLVTETTVGNLAARIGGQWLTPPVQDGCLPGIGRQVALERGELREASISVEQLRAATQLAVLSSAMGWRPAKLVD